MDRMEHIKKHKELHKSLDELIADMINHTNKIIGKTSVLRLLEWSFEQTINPTEEE